MADPTNARTRTLESFFGAPRVPIKQLPRAEGEAHQDHDDDRVRRGELPQWNAYVGPPR